MTTKNPIVIYEKQVFTVDPNRYDKNRIDSIPKVRVNPYTGQAIIHEISTRQAKCPLARREAIWSYQDLRMYLEKFFVYQRDFKRIAEFLALKQCKDCIDLWYMIKKVCRLSEIEKDLLAFVGNKL